MGRLYKSILTVGFVGIFLAKTAQAQTGALAAGFNFDGVLLDSSDVPLSGAQSLNFKIYDPAGTCLLFEENHTGVTLAADGSFSVKVGAERFELTTPCSQNRCATRLRYAPDLAFP